MKATKTIGRVIFIIVIALVGSCKKNDGRGFIQLLPSNGSSNVGGSQIFSCTPVNGAVSYTFSFTDGGGTFLKTIATDTILIQNLKPCDTYTWTVTANLANGNTVTCNPSWIFTTVSNSVVPCLQSPSNSSQNVCVYPQFSWTPVSGVNYYDLVIATDPNFYSIVFNDTVSNSFYTLSSALSANTQYYWEVCPGTSSLFSATYTFTTVAPPVLSYPTNYATSISRSPTFSWSSSTCTNNYSIDVATAPNFTNMVTTAQVIGTSYSIPSTAPLAAYTTYYWRIRVNDYVANSTASSFTTGLY